MIPASDDGRPPKDSRSDSSDPAGSRDGADAAAGAREGAESGSPDESRQAAADLVPILYGELRRLARVRMGRIPAGQTLQPTALVHEAFLRLAGKGDPGWNDEGHFFASAAQAMRQILVDQARRKAAAKHGGGRRRVDADEVDLPIEAPSEDLLRLDRAIERLEAEDPRKARIVLLRHFAGLDREETAAALGISVRTVDREWRYILARLHRDVTDTGELSG